MDSPWTKAYLKHFEHHLGKPFDVETYRSSLGIPLRLATYDSFENYRMYASIGLADEVNQDVGEVMLASDDLTKDVPFLFVNSLLFILERDIPLGSRFAVAGVDLLNPEFAEYYDKVAIYYTLAGGRDDGFNEVQCEGETGKVYQGIFISAAELDLVRRKGPDAFEEKFKKQEGELYSLRRESCV